MGSIDVTLGEQLETYELLEFQGDVESSSSLDSQILGYLLESGNKSEFIIQNKLMDGAGKAPLSKPLYTLQKNEHGEYEIVGVIREKYMFKTRPNPLSPRTVENKTGHPLVIAQHKTTQVEKQLKL